MDNLSTVKNRLGKGKVFSPCKINLGLSLVGRRDDGFHLLESLFWPLTFGDTIELRAGKGRVAMQWAEDAPFTNAPLPTKGNNLVTRVLTAQPGNLLSSHDIFIEKRIPMGGGLGGGSSNVGTLLKHLYRDSPLALKDLTSKISRFGADIPFFLSSQPSWISGIGEEIFPLKCDAEIFQTLTFLLVLFPFGCDTSSVFKQYQKSGTSFSDPYTPFGSSQVSWKQLKTYLAQAHNDLESVVGALHPNVQKVIEKLRSQDCLYAGLSGSGSTCFAVFDHFEKREKTTQDLQPFFRSLSCTSICAETFIDAHS